MKLTFHIEDGVLWACDDEGRSRHIDASKIADLCEWWKQAPPLTPAGGRTAAILADLAQARSVQPLYTGRQVAAFRTIEGQRTAIGPLVTEESQRLSEVLKSRSSARTFGTINVQAIATLLVRCARLEDWRSADDGFDASHRPAPSAGARHPFELLLLTGNRVEGLEAGVFDFDSVECALVKRSNADLSSESILNRIGEQVGAAEPPPAAVCLVGHLDRTLSRYPGGMSLVWRDAGVLLQTLHLCAADLGLRSCVVGTCGLLDEDHDDLVVDMGVLAVGGGPTASD